MSLRVYQHLCQITNSSIHVKERILISMIHLCQIDSQNSISHRVSVPSLSNKVNISKQNPSKPRNSSPNQIISLIHIWKPSIPLLSLVQRMASIQFLLKLSQRSFAGFDHNKVTISFLASILHLHCPSSLIQALPPSDGNGGPGKCASCRKRLRPPHSASAPSIPTKDRTQPPHTASFPNLLPPS